MEQKLFLSQVKQQVAAMSKENLLEQLEIQKLFGWHFINGKIIL